MPQTKRMKTKYTPAKCSLTAKLIREGAPEDRERSESNEDNESEERKPAAKKQKKNESDEEDDDWQNQKLGGSKKKKKGSKKKKEAEEETFNPYETADKTKTPNIAESELSIRSDI